MEIGLFPRPWLMIRSKWENDNKLSHRRVVLSMDDDNDDDDDDDVDDDDNVDVMMMMIMMMIMIMIMIMEALRISPADHRVQT